MAKYKVNEDGSIAADSEGRPIVIGDDGKEFGIDAIAADSKIKALSVENKGYRKKAADRKKELEKFADIEDPAAAIAALQTVGSMSEDHKVEVEKLKESITKAYETKLADKDAEITELVEGLFESNVLSKFATSDVIKKTIFADVPDVAALKYKGNFKKDGTAVDHQGNPILSKENPAEPAKFNEALSVLIETDPKRDAIMLGSGASGGGSQNAGGGGGGTDTRTGTQLIADGLDDL